MTFNDIWRQRRKWNNCWNRWSSSKKHTEETVLSITVDQSLSFKKHVTTLCRKFSQKFHALARICRCIDTGKLQHLTETFFYLSYCNTVWLFFDRTLNHRINPVHERALRIKLKENRHDFGLLLEEPKSIPVHIRSLQLLMTEIYKTKSNLNPPFLREIFREHDISYNLRHGNDTKLPNVRGTTYGVITIDNLGNKLRQLLPHET